MEGLFSLPLFAALFFAMMRWGCGAHMAHGHARHGGHRHGIFAARPRGPAS